MVNNTKNFLTAILVFFLIPITSFADSSVWQVSKNNNHIYLGGTIHILPQSAYPLPPEFDFAYRQSSMLVLETEIPDPLNASFQQKLRETVTLPAPQTLSAKLNTTTLQALKQHLKAANIALTTIDHYKAGFAVTLLTTIAAKRAGIDGQGVDQYYYRLATADSKNKQFLESVNFQLQLLASLGEGNENAMVTRALEDLVNFEKNFHDIRQAWRAGNTEQLSQLIVQPMLANDPVTYQRLITQRNHQWLTQIEMLFTNSETEFLLVGVGHLIGQDNLLDLLTRRGYQVSKLTLANH